MISYRTLRVLCRMRVGYISEVPMFGFVRNGWRTFVSSTKDVIVVPIGDLKPHLEGRECWCDPRLENSYEDPTWLDNPEAVVVIHNAADGRD